MCACEYDLVIDLVTLVLVAYLVNRKFRRVRP